MHQCIYTNVGCHFMGQRRTLNQKRLTKKEVRHLIDTEGKLHEQYTNFFEEKYVTAPSLQHKNVAIRHRKYDNLDLKRFVIK